MFPYYALIGIPIMYAFYYELRYEKRDRIEEKKNNTLVVFFTLYGLLLAFRSPNVGVDTVRYIEIYHVIESTTWGNIAIYFPNSEKGYLLLNKILAIVFGNEQWLLIVVAVLCVVPIAILYYKESKNGLISMALFLVMPLFQMNFSGVRQSLAIAFVLPALYFTRNKSILKFLLTVIVAMLFHRSAIILLVLYPLYYIRLNRKHLVLLIPLGILVFYFKTQIFTLTSYLLMELLNESYGGLSETGAYTMLLVYMVFCIYAFFIPDEKKMSETAKGFRNYLVFATFLQIFAAVNPIAMRMNYYFIVFIPIVISQITHNCRIRNKRIVFLIEVLTFLVFMAYYLKHAHSADDLSIYPYEFFWSYN